MGLKKVESATLHLPLKIVPLPGYHMLRMAAGEYLVVNDAEHTNNVIVEADTAIRLLLDHLDGGPVDQFQGGLGTMWTMRGADE